MNEIEKQAACKIRPEAADSADEKIDYRAEKSEAKTVDTGYARPNKGVVHPPEYPCDERKNRPDVNIHNDPCVKSIGHSLYEHKDCQNSENPLSEADCEKYG